MVDALVRLGGTLRLCVGVWDSFEEADLLACSPCLLIVSVLSITLNYLTLVIFSGATTSTLEATSLCSGRRISRRQCMPSTFGELMPDLPRRRQSLVRASPTATTSMTRCTTGTTLALSSDDAGLSWSVQSVFSTTNTTWFDLSISDRNMAAKQNRTQALASSGRPKHTYCETAWRPR